MIESLMQNETVAQVLVVLGAIYAVATAVAAITPSDKDNSLVEKVGKWADKIGLNLKGK